MRFASTSLLVELPLYSELFLFCTEKIDCSFAAFRNKLKKGRGTYRIVKLVTIIVITLMANLFDQGPPVGVQLSLQGLHFPLE